MARKTAKDYRKELDKVSKKKKHWKPESYREPENFVDNIQISL